MNSVQVDAHNLIAHVDGRMTLLELGRALERQGFVLPIARPWPRMTLARAAVALPYLVDAFVQQASGQSASGAPFETVAAPRAAIGPSLIHAMSTRPPLLLLERARLRIAARPRVKIHVATLASPADVAALLTEVADEARALAVEAVGTRVVALVPAGTRGVCSRFDTTDAWAHARGGFLSSTRSIGAADRFALEDAIARGERVLSAPFMGRAAVGQRARVAASSGVELRAAVEAMARALASGARTSGASSSTSSTTTTRTGAA